MLPNRRKVKLITLAISLMPSSIPTKKSMKPVVIPLLNPLKFRNLPAYRKRPRERIPQNSTKNMAISAIARVVFRPVLAFLKNGISSPTCWPSGLLYPMWPVFEIDVFVGVLSGGHALLMHGEGHDPEGPDLVPDV